MGGLIKGVLVTRGTRTGQLGLGKEERDKNGTVGFRKRRTGQEPNFA